MLPLKMASTVYETEISKGETSLFLYVVCYVALWTELKGTHQRYSRIILSTYIITLIIVY